MLESIKCQSGSLRLMVLNYRPYIEQNAWLDFQNALQVLDAILFFSIHLSLLLLFFSLCVASFFFFSLCVASFFFFFFLFFHWHAWIRPFVTLSHFPDPVQAIAKSHFTLQLMMVYEIKFSRFSRDFFFFLNPSHSFVI